MSSVLNISEDIIKEILAPQNPQKVAVADIPKPYGVDPYMSIYTVTGGRLSLAVYYDEVRGGLSSIIICDAAAESDDLESKELYSLSFENEAAIGKFFDNPRAKNYGEKIAVIGTAKKLAAAAGLQLIHQGE